MPKNVDFVTMPVLNHSASTPTGQSTLRAWLT